MSRPVVLFALADSPLAARVAARLAERDVPVCVLDLDAPLSGEPVTVRDAAVTWQGCDLGDAAALWCEQPVFPWPQMIPPPCDLPDAANFERWRHYQREARALAVAALAAAAETVPLLGSLAAAHLAVMPTVALDRLAAAGLDVQPWRVTAAPPGSGELVRDATGRDRWHRPAAVAPSGRPRRYLAPVAGPVTEVLVIGGAVAAARRWPNAAAWNAGDAGAPAAAGDLAEPACRGARALDLEILQVALAGGMPAAAILEADAAPDLAAWDALAAGAVAAALAERLAALAARP